MTATADMPTRLAIGLVTYNNSPAHLRRLTRAIDHAAGRLDPARYAVAVYSIDCGEPAEWSDTQVPHARLSPRGNLGFGGGMNALMESAFADPRTGWFLCHNPDGLPHRDLFAELIRWAERYADGLVEARQFPEEHPKPYHPDTGQTLWASGACLLIPRAVYAAIGGFDPNIFMYMEDVDFSWRAAAAGFSIRVAPRALFAHSVLDRAPCERVAGWYYASARYLAYKWGITERQEFYESVIRERKYQTALPPLPPLVARESVPPADRSPATFEYGFPFAPVRWGG
jgi:hypothetical protein